MKRPLLFIGNLIVILFIIPVVLTAQFPPDAIWMNAKNDVPGDPAPPHLKELVNCNFHKFGPDGVDYDTLVIKIRANDGMAFINDSAGELLLYSNGYLIGNRFGDYITGGGENLYNITDKNSLDWDVLRSNAGIVDPQNVIILPDPVDSLIFHLFHIKNFVDTTMSNYVITSELNHSIVSMLDSERSGVMIQLPTKIIEESVWMSNLTAQRHADGKTWWLISRSRENEDFLIFILDADGIKYSHRSNSYRPYIQSGRAIFSPDGRYLAVITPRKGDRKLEVILYRFYDVSGELYFDKIISTDWNAFILPGLAFSPNSKFLYFTAYDHIFQLDIREDLPEIKLIDVMEDYRSTRSAVFNSGIFDCKLSPDCRILTSGGKSIMHSIDQPDEVGYASIPNQRVILNERLFVQHLPNTPHYRNSDEMEFWCETYGYKDTGNPRLLVAPWIERHHYTFEEWTGMHLEPQDKSNLKYLETEDIGNQLIEYKKD